MNFMHAVSLRKSVAVIGLCALVSGFAVTNSSAVGFWEKIKQNVPTDLLPKNLLKAMADADRFFAGIDATVTSAKYQYNRAMVSKDRAVALGSDLGSLLQGDWGSILGSGIEADGDAAALDSDLAALVVRSVSARDTVSWAAGKDDPLENAVAQWLGERLPGGDASKLLLTRKRTETASQFRVRAAAGQAALDEKLAATGDLEKVLTITGLPVIVSKRQGDRLPVTVRLGLMSLTPTGLYGFDYGGLKDKACSEFVAAGEGLTLVVCGGAARETIETLGKTPDAIPARLYAEVDVTIAAMSALMPQAHEAMLRTARASFEATTDPTDATLLALPAIHIRELRIKADGKSLLIRRPYFVDKLLTGDVAVANDARQ